MSLSPTIALLLEWIFFRNSNLNAFIIDSILYFTNLAPLLSLVQNADLDEIPCRLQYGGAGINEQRFFRSFSV